MEFDIDELMNSTAFWILSGVGIAAFSIMLIVLKTMGNADFMPWWVKVITFVAIPIVAALFTGYASGD